MIYTYGEWQRKIKITYAIGIISAILWIVYNYIVGAYIVIIGSLIELIAAIIGILKVASNKNVK